MRVSKQAQRSYTSQECSSGHYVDKTNRPSQTKFACRWCGNATHAEVDASRIVNQRCALGLGKKWLTKGAILAVLVSQHIKRWPLVWSNGPRGATHRPSSVQSLRQGLGRSGEECAVNARVSALYPKAINLIPLTISRSKTLRSLPPRFAGGIDGAMTAHSLSVSSLE
jgi:hypothetical protein